MYAFITYKHLSHKYTYDRTNTYNNRQYKLACSIHKHYKVRHTLNRKNGTLNVEYNLFVHLFIFVANIYCVDINYFGSKT